MRVLTDHRAGVSRADDLTIRVMDAPGAGGAHHHYQIIGFSTASNAADPFVARHGSPAEHATVLFQNGPIAEAGLNGVTVEALLAICADRLRCFEAGPYACAENAQALAGIEAALDSLHSRTKSRVNRGVEGTSSL